MSQETKHKYEDLIGKECWQVYRGGASNKITVASRMKLTGISPKGTVYTFERGRWDTRQHDLELLPIDSPQVLAYQAEKQAEQDKQAAYEQTDQYKAGKIAAHLTSFFEHQGPKMSLGDLRYIEGVLGCECEGCGYTKWKPEESK